MNFGGHCNADFGDGGGDKDQDAGLAAGGEQSGVTRLAGEGGATGDEGKGEVVISGGGAMGGRPTFCQWLQAFTK